MIIKVTEGSIQRFLKVIVGFCVRPPRAGTDTKGRMNRASGKEGRTRQ